MTTATAEPTVMVVFTNADGQQEAAAFDEAGEIIVTGYDEDGNPEWGGGQIADPRGGGGVEGFQALHAALEAAERNAVSVGLAMRRVRT
jgi:hypothetical protein